ncbi:GTP-binding protein [Suillus clintonianus]|uniref:GTP-binding protein n=1 Tax=Suillus clintonianus TaxID=1904413 RepID=UPI001B85C781|nr:GTP-binding protein [Suillus clintonianus]KAG2125448.1 GTP-binding protein [Suillus clintonianus]
MDPSEIKEKIHRFRILIIGRANAGKTTILQRVCNTKENPDIYNSAGKKIDAALLTASRERGEHDIENEMVFPKNPGFIFHDSRGFEAGGESEYDKVNTFIKARSKEADIKDRIHTIWYCIPMDQASRCFTEAERKFFSRCDTGSIPVIVLFTKFDALYDVEFAQLTDNGTSRKDAKKLAPKHAEETFANGPQLKFLYDPKTIRRPPKCHVCLPDMNKDDADCGPLIERTAETLDNGVLQQLFVSTQQTNLELCMEYAVEKYLSPSFACREHY